MKKVVIFVNPEAFMRSKEFRHVFKCHTTREDVINAILTEEGRFIARHITLDDIDAIFAELEIK